MLFVDAPRLSYFENEYGFLWIDDGVLFAEYKPVVIDLKAVEAMIEARLSICNGKYYPTVADGRLVKYWTLESRKFSFRHKEAYTGLKSVAYVNASLMGNAIINWSIRFMNPKILMKLFNQPVKVLEWARQFLQDNKAN